MTINKIKSNKINNNELKVLNYKSKNSKNLVSNLEWNNSIFNFNTNNIKSLSTFDNIVHKLLKIYFSMYNLDLENKVQLKNIAHANRYLSIRKVWLSRMETKHTNDIIFINIYVYDRINNIISKELDSVKTKYELLKKISYKDFFSNDILQWFNNFILKNFELIVKKISIKKLSSIEDNNVINILINKIKINILNNLKSTLWTSLFDNEIKILYYEKFLKLNSLKYNSNYIYILQKLISNIYKKKVVFNIISLNNYYLSSNIFVQLLAQKNKSRNSKIDLIFQKGLKINTPFFKRKITGKIRKEKYIDNILFKDYDNLTNKFYKLSNTDLINNTLNNLNNKVIIGVRVQASGRLTKRFTAQRSVKKVKYIGTLKNIDSSFKGLSSQMVKNNINLNTQFSKISSANRIGSFGIKGWINSI
jgi:hypothetical protein